MKKLSILALSLLVLIGCGKTEGNEEQEKHEDKGKETTEVKGFTAFCESDSDDVASMRYYVDNDEILSIDAVVLKKGIPGGEAMNDEEIIEMITSDFSDLGDYSKGIKVTVDESQDDKTFIVNFPDLKNAPEEVKETFGLSTSLSYNEMIAKLDPSGAACKVE